MKEQNVIIIESIAFQFTIKQFVLLQSTIFLFLNACWFCDWFIKEKSVVYACYPTLPSKFIALLSGFSIPKAYMIFLNTNFHFPPHPWLAQNHIHFCRLGASMLQHVYIYYPNSFDVINIRAICLKLLGLWNVYNIYISITRSFSPDK